MAHCSVHPAVQQRLLSAQTAGEDPRAALAYALDLCGLPPGSALAATLLACPPAPAVLSAAAHATGHPCPQGMLLAQLLSGSLLHSSQLLDAVPDAAWASATCQLHEAASSGALPEPVRSTSRQAFAVLVKALLTAGAGSRRQAERALQELRRSWADGAGAEGGQLLAAVVEVADGQVFPRQLARSWLLAELAWLLAADGDHQAQQAPAAATDDAQLGAGAAWDAAMAAFAAALPPGALLQRVQEALRQGRLRCERAAALLAAAAAVQPTAAEEAQRWAGQQLAAALQQRDSGAAASLLHLQRCLLPRLGPGVQRHAQQHGTSAGQQQYAAWLASQLLAPPLRDGLQFLLGGVLLPLLPSDPPCWVQAQAEAVGGLLRAARHGQGQLPTGCLQLAERYLAQAQQQQQQQQQGVAAEESGGGAATGRGALPPAPASSLAKGRAIVTALLAEFEAGGGHLRVATLEAMQAKAANVFTRGELPNMLAPALLEPCGDPAAAAPRAALMRYLHREMGLRGDTQIRPHFQPEAVQRYEQLCLRAQLEAASLEQLAQRAPSLLLAANKDQLAGGGGGSHQLLDRLGRLVRQHLQRWQQQQQGSSAAQAGAEAPQGQPPRNPAQLAQLLVSVWSAAYVAGLGGASGGGTASGGGGASPAAVAAHVLSIAHGAPALHAPLLGCVRQALLQPTDEAGLEAAAMLASAAGALVAPTAAGAEGQQQQQPEQAPEAGSLRALFVWRLPPRGEEGAGQPAEVPGPLWLQRLLASLPLGAPCGAASAARAAAAHLRCARHFSRSSLLPGGSPDAAALLPRWGQAAARGLPAGAYDGELAASLAFPACPAALRLQQWLAVRLEVARQLLGAELGVCEVCSSTVAAVQRAAKRLRPTTDAGAATAASVLQGCLGCLRSRECAPLAEAAGPLPLADFLRLEAAAAAGGPDLLPGGTGDAVFRLCCALYLGSGSSGSWGAAAGEGQAPPLGSLVAPLAATPRGAPAAEVQEIPDSDDEQAAGNAAPAVSALLEGLAAAVAAVLAPAEPREQAGLLGVCQKACAQCVRLLAARRPGPRPGGSFAQLLAALLCSLAQRCRERLSVAAAGAGPGLSGLAGAAAPPPPLVCADEGHMLRMRRQLAALASGTALELLPLPLGSAEEAGAQQARLRDLAAAVDSALDGGGQPAVLQRLHAALGA